VLLHIRNYTNRLFIDRSDVIALVASYASDAGVMDVFGALLNGATLRPIDLMKDGLRRLPAILRESGVTFFHSTPTVFRHLVGALSPGEALAAVRRVVLGGEEARRSDVEAYRAHFGPACILVNGLGPTESTLALQYHVDRTTEISRETLPVGYPVEGVEVTLENALGEQVAVHGIGEVVLKSPQVALGYWRREEQRAAAFPADPASPGRRIYRTGDLARRLPGGALEYLGRIDHQVKIHGYRIELGEIESVLAKHPAVRQVVVAARQDDGRDKRLVAYVVPRASTPSPSLASALREHLQGRLPVYMVPATFVALDGLPLLPNGKVDRRALPPPDPIAPAAPAAGAKPREAIERELVRIWEEVLGVEDIGVLDNFFDLGGHSLLAIKLFDRIEKECGVSLPLACLFEAPTVAALGRMLRQKGWRPRWQSLVPIQSAGRRRPFFCVHAVGGNVLNYRLLSQHLGADVPFYGLQARGLGGHEAPHANVAEMAAAYIEELRQEQPEGPYQIGGASSGGVIAYEMAQQLHAAGERVSALVFFDTCVVGPRPPCVVEVEASSPLHHRALLLDIHLGQLLLRTPREGVRYLADRVKARMGGVVGAVARTLHAATPVVRNVIEATRRAVDDYVPRPYPGSAVMLLCRDAPHRTFHDGRLAWADLVQGGLVLRFIPGEHEDMLDEPRVAGAAAVLDRCLEP
jgi:thioesterase domain-containing protein/acyl carrier protein